MTTSLNRRALLKRAALAAPALILVPALVRPSLAQIIQFSGANPTDPWAAVDGRLNAPAGAAQYPALFSGYAARPPWQVSGVDYKVGYPTGQVFKQLGVDSLPAGVVQVDTDRIDINSGTNTTLDGWDFSFATLGDHMQLLVWGGTNATFLRNNLVGARIQWRADGGTASGGTIKYNVIDHETLDVGAALSPVVILRTGDFIVQYNWIRRAAAVLFQMSGPQNLDFRFNLIEDAGCGPQPDYHGDWIQSFGDNIITSYLSNFNVFYQHQASSATQGVSLAASTPTYMASQCCNNTMIARVNTNPIVITARQWLATPFQLKDNYVDPTATDPGNFYQDNSGFGPGPFPGGSSVVTGNINMLTGGSIS